MQIVENKLARTLPGKSWLAARQKPFPQIFERSGTPGNLFWVVRRKKKTYPCPIGGRIGKRIKFVGALGTLVIGREFRGRPAKFRGNLQGTSGGLPGNLRGTSGEPPGNLRGGLWGGPWVTSGGAQKKKRVFAKSTPNRAKNTISCRFRKWLTHWANASRQSRQSPTCAPWGLGFRV